MKAQAMWPLEALQALLEKRTVEGWGGGRRVHLAA